MSGTKQIRRLKVIPEERKKPWSSPNFLKRSQRKWAPLLILSQFEDFDAL
jgi:hypothetical protein